jgi:DNA mismatch repair ATPase MutS
MRQLVKAGATGIVATHDLDLTALAAENRHVANHHFDSRVEGDNLAFDFKIKPGVCASFNALVLMKKMGLDV